MIAALERAEPSGQTGVGNVLNFIGGRLRKKGIVIVISDFFADANQLVEGMRMLKHAGHEPILFQVLDPQELTFDFKRLLRLDGFESTGRLKVDPKAIRNAYLEEVQNHIAGLKRHAQVLSCDFISLTTSQPLDVALSTYLAHRAARARTRS
jgi:hypothetical protein